MPGHCALLFPRVPPLVVAVCLALAGIGVPVLATEDPGIALPPVLNVVLDQARDLQPETASRQEPIASGKGRAALAPPSHLEVGPVTLNVTPGVNVLIEIAIDQLNRILTPFPHPQVRTVSEASTSVDGSAVYLATASEAPITLFISDASDPNQALSLTLAPRRIPPRELRLVLTDPLPLVTQATRPPVSPGASAPAYVERLTEAMRALAREALPEGYGLRPARRDETVDCVQDGIKTRRGQVLDGQDLLLVTALVRNVSSTRLEIEERACRARGDGETVAVAAWPRVWLEPGETVELYLAVRPTPPERVHPARPSLLDAGRR